MCTTVTGTGRWVNILMDNGWIPLVGTLETQQVWMTCKHYSRQKIQRFEKNVKLRIYFLVPGCCGHSGEHHITLRKGKCLSTILRAWSPQPSNLYSLQIKHEHPVLTKSSRFTKCHGNHKISSVAWANVSYTYQSVELSNTDVLWIHHCILFPRYQVQSQLSRKKNCKTFGEKSPLCNMFNNFYYITLKFRYTTHYPFITHSCTLYDSWLWLWGWQVARLDTDPNLRSSG